ncbi:hypothetical protein BaRGS_00031752, partial [Batillaria attramentaria]
FTVTTDVTILHFCVFCLVLGTDVRAAGKRLHNTKSTEGDCTGLHMPPGDTRTGCVSCQPMTTGVGASEVEVRLETADGMDAAQEEIPSPRNSDVSVADVENEHAEDIPVAPECKKGLINNTSENEAVAAVRVNNYPELQRLAENSFDFNATCHWEGAPCVVRAQVEGYTKQLQLMGYAALHVAVIHSSLKTISFLLGNGADINIRDKNQRTALQLAVAVNRLGAARLLINRGAKINTCSLSGRSPLMEAVMNFSLPLTNLLISSGADVDMPDSKGTTPLLAAINSSGRPQDKESAKNIVRSLLNSGCIVDKTNPAGASPLMLASGLKNVPVIHMLVAAGANVNLHDSSNRTAFTLACEGQRNVATLETLMRYGAATNIADNKGKTPLDKALKFGSLTVLRLLLSADAAPHRYDILNAPRIVQLRQILPEFDVWLHHELYEPRNLRRLCREVIRQQLSPHNLPFVGELGLPRTLNDFLLGAET